MTYQREFWWIDALWFESQVPIPGWDPARVLPRKGSQSTSSESNSFAFSCRPQWPRHIQPRNSCCGKTDKIGSFKCPNYPQKRRLRPQKLTQLWTENSVFVRLSPHASAQLGSQSVCKSVCYTAPAVRTCVCLSAGIIIYRVNRSAKTLRVYILSLGCFYRYANFIHYVWRYDEAKSVVDKLSHSLYTVTTKEV